MGICGGRPELLESGVLNVEKVHHDSGKVFSAERVFSIVVSPGLSYTPAHSLAWPERRRDSIELVSECEVPWKLDIENPCVEVEVLPTPNTSISQNVCWTIPPESLLLEVPSKRENEKRTGSFSISRSNSPVLRTPLQAGTPLRVYPSHTTTTTSSPQTPKRWEVECQDEQNFYPQKSKMFITTPIDDLINTEKMRKQANIVSLNIAWEKDSLLRLNPSSAQSSFSLVTNGCHQKEQVTDQQWNVDSESLNYNNQLENSNISQIKASIEKIASHEKRSKEEYMKDLNKITRWDIKRVSDEYVRQSRQIQLRDLWTILGKLSISVKSFNSLYEGYNEGIEMRRSEQGHEDATSLDYESFVHALHCVEPSLKCDWLHQSGAKSRSASFATGAYEMTYEKVSRAVVVLRSSRSSPWTRREALLALPCLLRNLWLKKLESSESLRARENLMQNICKGIYTQLTGARSTFVIRQACLTVLEIHTVCESSSMGLLMSGLIVCLSRQAKPIISNSALFTAEVLIRSNLQTPTLVHAIAEGCNDPMVSVRIGCFKLLAECCQTTFAKTQPADGEFWKIVVSLCNSALIRNKAEFEDDTWAKSTELEGEQSKLDLQQELRKQLNKTLDSVALFSSIGLGLTEKIKRKMASITSKNISHSESNVISLPLVNLHARDRAFSSPLPRSTGGLVFPESEEISPHFLTVENNKFHRKSSDNSPRENSFSSGSSLNQAIVDCPFQTQPETPGKSKSTKGELNNRRCLSKTFEVDDVSVVAMRGLVHHNRKRSWIASDVDDRSIITMNEPGLFGHEPQMRVNWETKNVKLISLSEPLTCELDVVSPNHFLSQPILNELEAMNQSSATLSQANISCLTIARGGTTELSARRVSISRSASKSCFEPKTTNEVTKISLAETFLPYNEDVMSDGSKSVSSRRKPAKICRDMDLATGVITRFQELQRTTTKTDLKREYERISYRQKLNYRDFCLTAVEVFKLPWSVDKCKKTFKKFDKGNKKFISAEDFEMAFYEACSGVEAFWLHLLRPEWINANNKEESISDIADVEKCYELLKDKGEDWKRRIRALEALPALVPRNDTAKFELFILRFKECLKLQIQDRRSQVSKVACDITAKMVEESAELFFPYTPFLLEALYEIVAMKAIKVTRVCANECCISIFRSVTDTKDNRLLLHSIVSATGKPHGSVRESAFEHLKIYIENIANGANPTSEDSLDDIEKILYRGIADRLSSVRKNAFLALGMFLEVDQRRSQRLLKSMSTAVRKRFAKQIGRPDLAPKERRPLRRKRIRQKRPLSTSAPIKE